MFDVADLEKLRNAVKEFECRNSPSNISDSSHYTNEDANRLIREFKDLLDIFVQELEEE